jgi:hypothetical protein
MKNTGTRDQRPGRSSIRGWSRRFRWTYAACVNRSIGSVGNPPGHGRGPDCVPGDTPSRNQPFERSAGFITRPGRRTRGALALADKRRRMDGRFRRTEGHRPSVNRRGPIAQLVERRSPKPVTGGGSSPSRPTWISGRSSGLAGSGRSVRSKESPLSPMTEETPSPSTSGSGSASADTTSPDRQSPAPCVCVASCSSPSAPGCRLNS